MSWREKEWLGSEAFINQEDVIEDLDGEKTSSSNMTATDEQLHRELQISQW